MITSSDVIALGITLPVLDALFVTLRLGVKWRRTGSLGIDDILIIFTLV
jgi:hypothetical protein